MVKAIRWLTNKRNWLWIAILSGLWCLGITTALMANEYTDAFHRWQTLHVPHHYEPKDQERQVLLLQREIARLRQALSERNARTEFAADRGTRFSGWMLWLAGRR